MDRSPKSAHHRPAFLGSVSQETPYVPYQNPHNRPAPFGRSSSSSGPSSPRSYGAITPAITPPGRPSSPSRHHRRTHSAPRPVKETLDASFKEDDGVRRVNHYILKREIGRGSFGVVHLGIDSSTGEEFAIKEFSKSKLRKRSQSLILRRTHTPGSANPNPGSSGSSSKRPSVEKRRSASDIHLENELADSLYLVRGEIAIMKKLNHENVVKLVEVLDDPKGDGLYMVIEYCKHGPVMDIGLDKRAHPYTPEQARNLFRDLLLGIEYLHAQGIVHRDIKPDNLLLDSNDVLKIVDFGVSEMFTKEDDRLKSSSGSPAFASPELSHVGTAAVSGKAADIWAMGVTLYALIYGCLPFNNHNVLELYENIRHENVYIPDNEDKNLVDLFNRILEKDPVKRIKMPELREHPWVTADSQDPLLSAEENTAEMVTHVTEKDYADAIKGIRGVMHVVRAVHKLKSLSRHGKELQPNPTSPESNHRQTKSLDIDRGGMAAPHQHHVKKFLHDHLGVNYVDPPREITDVKDDDLDIHLVETDTPLTPKIKVLAPTDDISEDEIQYIGVGLGSTSSKDKKRRDTPGRASSEPILGRRGSNDSLHSNISDTSGASGSLTPSEPMVYASPIITHENVFEEAFQRAEDRIRLEGKDTLYNTWRSEEMRGHPVTNPHGREKVELERVDDDQPRWERVLREKLPAKMGDKIGDISRRSGGDGKTALKNAFAAHLLGQMRTEGVTKPKGAGEASLADTENKGSVEGPRKDDAKECEKTDVDKGALGTDADNGSHKSKWGALLGGMAQKHIDGLKGAVEGLKSGVSSRDIPESTAFIPSAGQS